ncbi:hypothetical protein AB4225_06110 [Streptomyces sp. 2RAF24]|uniref:hypothetical protein n=1 Tax=Streptomyces sp. 2RAF24 TaxID=3232997 RepID=UPI003F946AB8
MPARTLPRHPRTGLQAVAWRKPRPGENPGELYPVWPILGGAPGDGDDTDDTDDDQDDDADESDTDDKGDDKVDHEAEAKKWKALARKHEGKSKENAAAVKELARLKREGMSDVDKKVDEAVAAARAEERTRAGERVARSAFLAAAKGRIENAKDVLDDINLRRYVDDDGEVDDEAIAALVDKLAPDKGGDQDDDEGDDQGDKKRRRRQGGGYQGTRRRGGGGRQGGSVADGAELYRSLTGGGTKT